MPNLLPHLDFNALKKHNRSVLGWGLGGIALVAIIFVITLLKIHLDRKDLLDKAREEAISRSGTAAEQVSRLVSQIDQLSLAIKYQWEHRAVPLDLDEQYRQGVFEKTIYPVVINAKGYAVSSTRQLPKDTFMGDLPFFIKHSQDPKGGLLISAPTDGRGGLTGKKSYGFRAHSIVRTGHLMGWC